MIFKKKIKEKVGSSPPMGSTPTERIVHLSHKTRHYERNAENTSKKISRTKTKLIFGNILTILLMLYLFILHNNQHIGNVILSIGLISLGFIAGFITLILVFFMKGKKSRKLKKAAKTFSRLKMECDHAIAKVDGKDTEENSEALVKEYLRLSKKYELAKAEYVKYREEYSSYYHFIGGPGQILGD